MKKFLLGLVIALILGTLANTLFGYLKFGYFQNPDKILGGLAKVFGGADSQAGGVPVDKDIKQCQDLVPKAASFGTLKVTILASGKPVENLEVDLNTRPGPTRCTQKTNKEGTAVFTNVPTGKMAIYFNNSDFPKEFNSSLVEPVDITSNQTTQKVIELKR